MKQLSNDMIRTEAVFDRIFKIEFSEPVRGQIALSYGAHFDMEILKSQIVTSNSPSNLKSQFATSSLGDRRTNSDSFTEREVAMLSKLEGV